MRVEYILYSPEEILVQSLSLVHPYILPKEERKRLESMLETDDEYIPNAPGINCMAGDFTISIRRVSLEEWFITILNDDTQIVHEIVKWNDMFNLLNETISVYDVSIKFVALRASIRVENFVNVYDKRYTEIVKKWIAGNKLIPTLLSLPDLD